MPGKHATDEQRKAVARDVARGEKPSVAARAHGVSPRTARRWSQDPAFQKMVASYARADERKEHELRRAQAVRHGMKPGPPFAEAERDRQAFEQAGREVRERATKPATVANRQLSEEQSADLDFQRFIRTPQAEIEEMIRTGKIPSRHSYEVNGQSIITSEVEQVRRQGAGIFGIAGQAEQAGWLSAQAREIPDAFAGMYGGSDRLDPSFDPFAAIGAYRTTARRAS